MVERCRISRKQSSVGVATIRRAELSEAETSMTAANDQPFAEPWKPPASSSSTRTAVAPVLGFENREKKSPANKPIRRMSRRP